MYSRAPAVALQRTLAETVQTLMPIIMNLFQCVTYLHAVFHLLNCCAGYSMACMLQASTGAFDHAFIGQTDQSTL